MRRLLVVSLIVVGSTCHAQKVDADDVIPRMSERRKYQLGSKFIERLAWCETHGDWKNGGNWSGGLGIARSTWRAYGGRRFGSTPDRATKRHQIVIANRIALWGYTRKDGRFVFPVGLSGWGGLDCARPVSLIRRRIDGSLAFSRWETGDPYA